MRLASATYTYNWFIVNDLLIGIYHANYIYNLVNNSHFLTKIIKKPWVNLTNQNGLYHCFITGDSRLAQPFRNELAHKLYMIIQIMLSNVALNIVLNTT